jgi:hypothetical protein
MGAIHRDLSRFIAIPSDAIVEAVHRWLVRIETLADKQYSATNVWLADHISMCSNMTNTHVST